METLKKKYFPVSSVSCCGHLANKVREIVHFSVTLKLDLLCQPHRSQCADRKLQETRSFWRERRGAPRRRR